MLVSFSRLTVLAGLYLTVLTNAVPIVQNSTEVRIISSSQHPLKHLSYDSSL